MAETFYTVFNNTEDFILKKKILNFRNRHFLHLLKINLIKSCVNQYEFFNCQLCKIN